MWPHMKILHSVSSFVLLAQSFVLGACGAQPTGDAQNPPTESAAALSAWLDKGEYKNWKCEASANTKTEGDAAIHVHGMTRVCSNDVLANGTAPWAKGAASVKEIWKDGAIVGLDAYVKTKADSEAGQSFYYYNGTPESVGTGGAGRSECSTCHSAAGSDAAHPGAGDFVYTRG
jgi:hypothetical protein